MQKKCYSYTLILMLFLINSYHLDGQVHLNRYSDKNQVYAINITHDTVWIGSSGGVVVRNLAGDSINMFTVNNGLSTNYITSIAVDSVGNKWFGTFDNGLIRYNNGNWEYFHIPENPLVPFTILSLEVDGSGILWAGTPNGVITYNGNTFTAYNTASTIQGEIKSICIDGPDIWFGSAENGFYRYNGSWQNMNTSNGLISNNVNDIAASGDSLIIVTNAGVSYYNKNSHTFNEYILAGTEFLCVEIEPFTGYPWIGTSNGMYQVVNSYYYAFYNFNMTRYPIIKFSGNGDTWTAYKKDGMGAKQYNGTDVFPREIFDNSPSTNSISDMVSKDNTIYFATLGKGVIKFDGLNWSDHYNMDDTIKALALKRDTIYAATNHGYTLLIESMYESRYLGIPVNDIEIDKDSVIWFATDNIIFNVLNNVQSAMFDPGLLNPSVKRIAVDSTNQIWFMHNNGLSRYDRANIETYTLDEIGASGSDLFDIAADTLGGVWIASSSGVIHYDGSNFIHLTVSDGLPENKILSVFIDKQNNKYFGTPNNGFSIFNGHFWRHYNRTDTLPAYKITRIQGQEFTKTIWAASDYGGLTAANFEPISIEISSNNQLPICQGTSITLNANVSGGVLPANRTYTWSSDNGTFSASGTTLNANPDTTTNYFLEVSDGFMSTNSEINIEVIKLNPSPISGPARLCSFTDTVLYWIPYDETRIYQWTVTNGNILSAQGMPSIEVSWNNNISDGLISLTEFDNIYGCSTNSTFPVIIETYALPNIVRKGENLIICTDSGVNKYQWIYNNEPIEGANRQFLYVDFNLPNTAGFYRIEFETPSGCKIISNEIQMAEALKIYPNPAKNYLNLDIYAENFESASIEIKNIYGILKEKINISNKNGFIQIIIDTNNYKPGIYTYQLINMKKIYATGKFIID